MTEDTASTPTLPPPVGYWTVVWRQFRTSHWSLAGLWMVGGFFFFAFFAPLLAHRLPFVWVGEDGERIYPLLREFIAPADTHEPILDRIFNFLLLFLPIALLLHWQIPTWQDARSRRVSLVLAAAFGLTFGGIAFSLIGSLKTTLVAWTIIKYAVWAVGTGITAALFLSYAWHSPASPRWLIILALAVLVIIPFFTVKSINDTTDYRKKRAAKKGQGIFPILAYGPNEQGFGPGLPPSWWMDNSWLEASSIRSWKFLARTIRKGEKDTKPTPRARIWGLLPPGVQTLLRDRADSLDIPKPIRAAFKQAQADRKAAKDSGGAKNAQIPAAIQQKYKSAKTDYDRALQAAEKEREMVLLAFNEIIATKTFYAAKFFLKLRIPRTSKAEIEALIAAADTLSAEKSQRLNRRLIEIACRRSILPGIFERQKDLSFHAPGYHVFGTDKVGRDVLARLIHGARVSLAVGFISVSIATALGLIIGSCAGFFGGWVDIVVSRAIEIMMCFPTFFLILTIVAIMDERSILNIMLVIGFTGWTGSARLIRGEVLKQRKLDYVASAQALGADATRTIFRHILPNAVAPVMVGASFGIAGAILTEAGLSFLGFGVAPPTATWGQLLNEARSAGLLDNWWIVLFPGLMIFLGVTAYNLIGEGLRDAMDPRLKT